MSELPEFLEGVDIAAGLVRVAGNKKLYKRLLLHLADDIPTLREKMSAAVMNGDMAALSECAHSLKGSSGNLAVSRVYEAAMALEGAARGQDPVLAFSCLDALELALTEYTTAATSLREQSA
jgi:two-component system sensor histidine kinase/response regulator